MSPPSPLGEGRGEGRRICIDLRPSPGSYATLSQWERDMLIIYSHLHRPKLQLEDRGIRFHRYAPVGFSHSAATCMVVTFKRLKTFTVAIPMIRAASANSS